MSDYSMMGYDNANFLAPNDGVDRLAAAACHGALLFGMPFLLPLGIFLVYPVLKPSAYVRNQALQALLFHAFFLLVTTATVWIMGGTLLSGLAGLIFHPLMLAWPLAFALSLLGGLTSLWCVVVMFIAALRALQGRPYRLPVIGNWVH